MDSFKLFFSQQWKRHLRHPALWVVIIVTMIGARFFIPLPGDGYVTLSINSSYPVLTSPVIGLQLGIIASLLMTPLAYIYLRAGPTKVQPWQIGDVTPSRRFSLKLGQGAADIAALWLVLFLIGIAGIILTVFRLPLSEVRPFQTFPILFVIAGPALAIIVGLRHFFDSRPKLRGAGGDVLFFLVWMAGNVIAAVLFEVENASLFSDMFGYAASASVSTDETITALAVGGAPSTEGFIELEPNRAFSNLEYLSARGFWLLSAIGMLVLSALVYRPRKFKIKKPSRLKSGLFSGADKVGAGFTLPVLAIAAIPHPYIRSVTSQILKPRWVVPVLMALSIAGFFFPFRRAVGPAIMLIMLLLIARYSAAWEKRHGRQLRSVMPQSLPAQFTMSFMACVILMAALLLPSMISSSINGTLSGLWRDFTGLIFIMPFMLILLGHITRTPTMGRLLMLGAWYAYMNV